jgi:hypothetical protein
MGTEARKTNASESSINSEGLTEIRLAKESFRGGTVVVPTAGGFEYRDRHARLQRARVAGSVFAIREIALFVILAECGATISLCSARRYWGS